jgi:acyl-CoA reductase-like NAD-dependent aldehyde dehydrogenase
MKDGKLLIGGKWIECRKKFESLNPATGEVLGRACLAGEKEVIECVKSARLASESWKKTGIWGRARILAKIGDEILKRAQELKTLITMEMGRPLVESEIEVIETSDMIKYFANEGKTYLEGDAIPINPELFPNKISFTMFEPIGVVGIIKPWNYPLELPFWAIAPAILTGNTVVFKPSELTPFVGIEIGKICQDAGVPDGVINVVTGDGVTGEYLVLSDVNMISFTGSVETGKKIMKNSAEKLHRISLELGGSDPFIVFKDADLEEAINGAVWGRFTNCGQVCVAAKRVFVDEDIADKFVKGFVTKTKNLVVGNGLDPATDIGPIVSLEQRKKVEEQVKDAVEKGARVECGGKISSSDSKGFYYEPTVLTRVTNEMRVMTEEVFGPVAIISTFSDIGEAIANANRTIYGLGASIWTNSLDVALRTSQELECGMVWINEINVAYAQCPWGGIKHSGIGKELSKHGIREFVNIKHINIDYGTDKTRPWWFPYKK